MNQQEYIDEFLGSYNDLGIVEDDAPGSDSYQDDEYEQLDNKEIEEDIREKILGRSQAEINFQASGAAQGGKQSTNRTLEKDGIDQRIMELKGQVKKRKIDLDDDASIPDMRVQRQKSSTLEDMNSTYTREQ